MKEIHLVLFIFWCFSITVWADDYFYYDDYDYPAKRDEDYIAELPKFLATPQSFSVEIGDEITLPCDVDKQSKNNNSYTLLFKYISPQNQDRTLYVGDLKVTRKSRIRKIGNSFVIPKVKRSDAGRYICRFETGPIVELSHTLNVQFPAKVSRVSEEVKKVVQGSTATLECEARGNPKPAITWSKKDGHLPSGLKSEEGLSITFENVNRYVEGTYICTAANGIGEPSSTFITLQVESAPEIKPEQEIMKTKDGYQAVLVCIVHGRPLPKKVLWYRSDSLVSSEKHFITHDGAHRHTLTINDLSEDDFGPYKCVANNTYGSANSTLYLTGLPKQPKMTSSPAGGEKSSYTLTWQTETFSPIIQYRLKYKKILKEGRRRSNGPSQWEEDKLFLPVKNSVRDRSFNHGVIEMRHPLVDLEPAEDYEAVISVENKFGWSPDSDIFHFFTRKELAVGRSATASAGGQYSSVSMGLVYCLIFIRLL